MHSPTALPTLRRKLRPASPEQQRGEQGERPWSSAKADKKLNQFLCFAFSDRHSSRNGFTLVELLVAFTLFATIISIVASIFVTSYRLERNITELVLVNDNTYLSLEQMARDVRDGVDFYFKDPFPADSGITCEGDCFGFVNRNNHRIVYDFSSSAIRRRDLDLPSPDDLPQNLTADNIKVVSFEVTHNCSTGNPVRMTINLRIRPTDQSNVSDFENKIQTTVSTRNYATCIQY